MGASDLGAADGGEKHPWQPQTKPFKSQVKRRIGELKDQPALRCGLDQSARVAEKQTAPKDKIIAITKSAERAGKQHRRLIPGGKRSDCAPKGSAGEGHGFFTQRLISRSIRLFAG